MIVCIHDVCVHTRAFANPRTDGWLPRNPNKGYPSTGLPPGAIIRRMLGESGCPRQNSQVRYRVAAVCKIVELNTGHCTCLFRELRIGTTGQHPLFQSRPRTDHHPASNRHSRHAYAAVSLDAKDDLYHCKPPNAICPRTNRYGMPMSSSRC